MDNNTMDWKKSFSIRACLLILDVIGCIKLRPTIYVMCKLSDDQFENVDSNVCRWRRTDQEKWTFEFCKLHYSLRLQVARTPFTVPLFSTHVVFTGNLGRKPCF